MRLLVLEDEFMTIITGSMGAARQAWFQEKLRVLYLHVKAASGRMTSRQLG